MIGRQPSRNGASESIEAFMERRRRETAAKGIDPAAAAYAAYRDAIRKGEDLALPRPGDVVRHGVQLAAGQAPEDLAPFALIPVPAPTDGAQAPEEPSEDPSDSVGHPGFLESLIPFWGSGREAIADWQEGDYLGAALNAALAVSDIVPVATAAKAIAKGGRYALLGPIYKGGKTDWKNISKYMHYHGMLEKNQHGHHWLIPNNGWGKNVPEAVKNHPINIMPMPSAATHLRLHHRYKGLPEYEWYEKLWHGTPHWSKAGAGSTVGHGLLGVEAAGRDR